MKRLLQIIVAVLVVVAFISLFTRKVGSDSYDRDSSETEYTEETDTADTPGEQHDESDETPIPNLGLFVRQRSFLIEVPLGGGMSTFGTGFFINDEGLALTNNHVFDGSRAANCFLYDNEATDDSDIHSRLRRDIDPAAVIFTDSVLDITVFRVALTPDDPADYLSLASTHVPQSTRLITVGNPVSETHGLLAASVSDGVLSGYRNQDSGRPLVQYTLTSNNGNSGGAVCDQRGRVVAVHDMGDKSMQNVNYGIDILAVRRVLDSLNLDYGGK